MLATTTPGYLLLLLPLFLLGAAGPAAGAADGGGAAAGDGAVPAPPPGKCGPPDAVVSYAGSSASAQILVDAWAGGYRRLCPESGAVVSGAADAGIAGSGGDLLPASPDADEDVSRLLLERLACPAAAVASAAAATTFGGNGNRDDGVGETAQPRRLDIVGTAEAPPPPLAECGGEGVGGTAAAPAPTATVPVATEGVAFVVDTGGVAADCVRRLGGGLTVDQLRWMYAGGGSSASKLWSDLHPLCEAESIDIAGLDGPSSRYFRERVMMAHGGGTDGNANGTSFDGGRYRGVDTIDELVSYVKNAAAGGGGNANYNGGSSAAAATRGTAIGFVPLAVALTGELGDRDVAAVSVFNDFEGKFVPPAVAAYEDGKYPLTSRLYLTLLLLLEASGGNGGGGGSAAARTHPFLSYGFSEMGNVDLVQSGFWPLHDWEKHVLMTEAGILSKSSYALAGGGCGPVAPNGGEDRYEIAIAGSSTVFPVARIWARIYETVCGGDNESGGRIEITVEGGGSSDGAGRVCADAGRGTPVDIGDMSRQWKHSEADRLVAAAGDDGGGHVYGCLKGDPSRSAVQIDVAVDGLTVAVQVDGFADQCIRTLGGLTTDQLRWIFSSYSDARLEETGWDPMSLRNTDRDPSTHLWSELDPSCPRVEIRIAGPDSESGTHEFFKQTVLVDHVNGETFDVDGRPSAFAYRSKDNDEELVSYLKQFPEAVSYFGYGYYYENRDSLSAAHIQNDSTGEFVAPTEGTISAGSYSPLARPIYMNLLNDPATLIHTVPFVKFGLLNRELVSLTGFIPVSDEVKEEMFNRLDAAPYDTSSMLVSSTSSAAAAAAPGLWPFSSILIGIAMSPAFALLLC